MKGKKDTCLKNAENWFKQEMWTALWWAIERGVRMEKRAKERYRPERPKFWLAGNKIGLEPAALACKPLWSKQCLPLKSHYDAVITVSFICWFIITKPQPNLHIQETLLFRGHLP